MVNAPFPAISWPSEPRKQAFDQWFSSVCNTHQIDASSLQVASADASFRRYFRAHRLGQAAHTVIVMDSPPQSENAAPFVQVAELLAKAQLPAPDILAWDEAHGFLLLSDLGRHTLLDVLSTPNANAAIPGAPFAEPRVARVFMEEAIDLLARWQLASEPGVLPPYDAPLLRRELMLFPEWYVAQHKGYALSETQAQVLHTSFERLIAHNLDAPQV